MMATVRFAKRIGPVRDRPLDANGVGGHSIGARRKARSPSWAARGCISTRRAADTEAFHAREPH